MANQAMWAQMRHVFDDAQLADFYVREAGQPDADQIISAIDQVAAVGQRASAQQRVDVNNMIVDYEIGRLVQSANRTGNQVANPNGMGPGIQFSGQFGNRSNNQANHHNSGDFGGHSGDQAGKARGMRAGSQMDRQFDNLSDSDEDRDEDGDDEGIDDNEGSGVGSKDGEDGSEDESDDADNSYGNDMPVQATSSRKVVQKGNRDGSGVDNPVDLTRDGISGPVAFGSLETNNHQIGGLASAHGAAAPGTGAIGEEMFGNAQQVAGQKRGYESANAEEEGDSSNENHGQDWSFGDTIRLASVHNLIESLKDHARMDFGSSQDTEMLTDQDDPDTRVTILLGMLHDALLQQGTVDMKLIVAERLVELLVYNQAQDAINNAKDKASAPPTKKKKHLQE